VVAQLDDVAKKNGFANYGDYNDVVENIMLVLGGFDPQTKKYVGPEVVFKQQIAAVQADKKMPAKDKKAALADLNAALKSPPPAVENKGNIDLVGKYYDKLAAAMQNDE
jgi:transcriptional regulator of aromatic amino acid metabolism